ncbi:MAG: cytochrome D ubiquinol oxidase subunit II, partial [Phycisphaerae bacterium]
LDELSREFADVITEGRIEHTATAPEEQDDFPDKPRITFSYNRRGQGRLRLLIDRINEFDTAPPADSSAAPAGLTAS